MAEDLAKQRQLVRAAVMYYVEGATQQDIASHLGVSRATAGRLVAQARADGIVRIEVESPLRRQVQIEVALESAYGLLEAVVIDDGDVTTAGRVDLGRGCADVLRRRLGPGARVGLGWGGNPGEWIARTAELLDAARRDGAVPDGLSVVQLAGAAPSDPSRTNPMRTVAAVADALSARELLIAAPLYVETADVARGLMADRSIVDVMAAVDTTDVCVFGVGHVSPTTSLAVNGYLTPTDLSALHHLEAVGDVCGRFFDRDGVAVQGDLAARTVGATLEQIAARPVRIAASAGPERVLPLQAAMSGRLANVVVTDTSTAQALVESATESRSTR